MVNTHYSDWGVWQEMQHKIPFFLLSLCWWASGHFSLVWMIVKFFIFYWLEKLLLPIALMFTPCTTSSLPAFPNGVICGLHQLSVCPSFGPLMNIRRAAIIYASGTKINEQSIFVCLLVLWKPNSFYLLRGFLDVSAQLAQPIWTELWLM